MRDKLAFALSFSLATLDACPRENHPSEKCSVVSWAGALCGVLALSATNPFSGGVVSKGEQREKERAREEGWRGRERDVVREGDIMGHHICLFHLPQHRCHVLLPTALLGGCCPLSSSLLPRRHPPASFLGAVGRGDHVLVELGDAGRRFLCVRAESQSRGAAPICSADHPEMHLCVHIIGLCASCAGDGAV